MTADLEGTEKQEKREYILNGNYIGNKGPAFGTRHVQILLMAFCLLIGIAMRSSLSVQIVAMTNKNSKSSNPDIPTYNWNNTSVILSSFFWSYVVVNIIAAPLEKKFGPKWFLLASIFLNSVAYIMIPFSAAHGGSTGVIVCRLLQGVGQGFLFPTQQLVLGLWAPAEERARAGVAAATGITTGAILASLLTGLLSTSWWGWPSSFYLFGAMGLLWCVFYLFLGQNSPATHPRITPEEKKYIQMSLNQHHNVEVPIPWRSILTSIPVWAVLVAQIGFAWTINMSMTEFSSYLANVMKFDIKSNGLYSSLPPGMGLIAGFIFGPLSDYIIKHQYISTLNARRIFHLSGGLALAAGLTYLSFLDESHRSMSIVIMVFIHVSQAAVVCGNGVNMVDLSPRFAGIIYGLANGISQAFALFAPLMVHFVVADQTDASQWKIVFLVTASLIAGTSIFFVIFASGHRQPWDGPKDQKFGNNLRKSSIFSVSGSITGL